MSDELVIKPTLDELRAGSAVLDCGGYAFFIQAWRVPLDNPLSCTVSGALFRFAVSSLGVIQKDRPACILGTMAEKPARAKVQLLTAPKGDVSNWKANDLAAQDLLLELPAVLPWLPAAQVYHLNEPRTSPQPEPSGPGPEPPGGIK